MSNSKFIFSKPSLAQLKQFPLGLSCLIFGCYSLPVVALSELEEVAVTASKIAQPLAKVGVSVEVLNQDDLEQRPYSSVADVLRTLPGIAVTNTGGLGKGTSVFMRGEDAFRTQLYIDGIRITDNTGPQVAPRFDNLLNQQLGRVEVLKGPQALLYGADSGGIISVFSKTAEKPVEADLNAEIGSYQYQALSGSVRGKSESVEYSLNASAVGNQGFNTRSDDSAGDYDGFRNTNVHSLVRSHFNDKASLGVVLRHNESNPEYDGCYNANFATVHTCEDTTESDAARVDWRYNTDSISQELAFTYHDNNNQRKISAAADPSSDTHGETHQAQYFGNIKINPQVALSLGIEAKKDFYQDMGPRFNRSGATIYREDANLEQYAAFSEWQISPTDDFSYTVGGRYDDSGVYGEHASFRLSSAYLVPTSLAQFKIHGAAGNGFRVPSFYEIYTNNHTAGPNAQKDFTHESSRGAEFGVDAVHAAVTVKATVFYSEIEDEIYYDSENYSGYVQTPGTSNAKGAELSSQWQATQQLILSAGFTHTKTRFGSAEAAGAARNQDRLRRPRNIYNVGVLYNGFAERLAISAFYRTAYNSVDYGGISLEDYAVLDLNGAWHFSPTVETYLRVRNALEENYEEVRRYQTESLSTYAGVRLKF